MVVHNRLSVDSDNDGQNDSGDSCPYTAATDVDSNGTCDDSDQCSSDSDSDVRSFHHCAS